MGSVGVWNIKIVAHILEITILEPEESSHHLQSAHSLTLTRTRGVWWWCFSDWDQMTEWGRPCRDICWQFSDKKRGMGKYTSMELGNFDIRSWWKYGDMYQCQAYNHIQILYCTQYSVQFCTIIFCLFKMKYSWISLTFFLYHNKKWGQWEDWNQMLKVGSNLFVWPEWEDIFLVPGCQMLLSSDFLSGSLFSFSKQF